MSWNTSVVTNAGVGLLNESLAGHTLTIESAVGGAGTQAEDEIKAATDVAEPKQTLKLIGIEDFEGGKRVGIQITNEGISESYILHQIGGKAHLEYEENLTLLFVLQDEHGVEIPAEAENPDFIFEVYAVISISNEANIDVTVNTGVTASVSYVDEKVSSELSKHNADTNSHQDIRAMATAAYNSETTYTAGTYCIYDGKLYKALADISAPEAWTESHWTPTSVGAELRELTAALSNKAEKYTKMLVGAGIPQTVQEILPLEPGIYSWVQEAALDWQPEDTPSGLMRVEFRIHRPNGSGNRTYELAYIDGATNLRRYFGEIGLEYTMRWKRAATAEPPISYSFPFQDGFFGTLKYARNQFGEVFLRGDIALNGGDPFTPGEDYIFGYLPEGYRPNDNIAAWISCGMRPVDGAITVPSALLIRPNGETSLHTPAEITTEAIICISAAFTTN